ncbi:MAG TPA: FkbM family methyltransferase [Stellaceae bacterium]|nr:FkbM family methyltransferase [Stellaceae bacterium]
MESEGDPGRLQALLGELARLRPAADPQGWIGRMWRARRRQRLLVRLDRDWPGGFTLHEDGALLYVPRPLDARGRHALLYPPRAHPAALACLRPGAVAADIGAGLGEWTLPFARAVGSQGRVLAVEAAPGSAAALANTLIANALHQAERVACAAGEHDGVIDFAVPVARLGEARIGAHETVRVPLKSLDSLAAERRLHRLDLIKITVGGQEREVLDGAEATLDRFRPALVLATGREAEGDRPAIHYRLRSLGYRPVGILLEDGMAEAGWQSYVAEEPPFRPGQKHRLLLVA